MSTDPARALLHARQLLELGRYQEAEQRARSWLGAHPGDVGALGVLGRALAGQDRHSEAVEALGAALVEAPDDPQVLVGLSESLVSVDRVDEARQAAYAAVCAAPAHWVGHYQYARALGSGDWPRLGDGLQVALHVRELAPTEPDAHNLVGTFLDSLNRVPEATESFRTALRLDPTHAPALANLSRIEAHAGGLGRASAMLRQGLHDHPTEQYLHTGVDYLIRQIGLRALLGVGLVGVYILGVSLSGGSWGTRALLGGLLVVMTVTVLEVSRRRLPGRMALWSPAAVRQLGTVNRILFASLAGAVAVLLLLAFLPPGAAATAALGLGWGLAVLGGVLVAGATVGALVSLVRGS